MLIIQATPPTDTALIAGGSISLLALNGLWELMQNYNLDYPEFFVKLYALFTPTLFHTRYLARFLRFSDLFLSSTYPHLDACD